VEKGLPAGGSFFKKPQMHEAAKNKSLRLRAFGVKPKIKR
jgi:hypothetical protein